MMIDLKEPQIEAARSRLIRYQDPTKELPTPAETRAAILTLLPAIDRIMLGICAGSWAEGILALQQYSRALNLPKLLPTPELAGSVYIKYNPTLSNCYASVYQGLDRGVLIAAQSDDLTRLNEMFGHLPLDLFAE
jgi:Domain of unknown function (DUF1824)